MPSILTQKQAAALLTLSERTLERLRVTGEGPLYLRLSKGRIAYREEDLVRWIAGHIVSSTSHRIEGAGQ